MLEVATEVELETGLKELVWIVCSPSTHRSAQRPWKCSMLIGRESQGLREILATGTTSLSFYLSLSLFASLFYLLCYI